MPDAEGRLLLSIRSIATSSMGRGFTRESWNRKSSGPIRGVSGGGNPHCRIVHSFTQKKLFKNTKVGEESKSPVNWGKRELSFAGRWYSFRGAAEDRAAKLFVWFWCLDLVMHASFFPAGISRGRGRVNFKFNCITSVA